MKQCSKCKTNRSTTEFCKNKHSPDGLNLWCRSCCRAYRQSTQGRDAAKRIYLRYHHSGKGKETKRAYYQVHNEKIRAAMAVYRQTTEGKEAMRRGGKRYAKTEKGRATRKLRTQTEKGKARNARKMAKRRSGLSILSTLTAEEWNAILEQYHHRCAYCGDDDTSKLTQDHYLPLKLGGQHVASNIVPACQVCNSKKNARHPHLLFG